MIMEEWNRDILVFWRLLELYVFMLLSSSMIPLSLLLLLSFNTVPIYLKS